MGRGPNSARVFADPAMMTRAEKDEFRGDALGGLAHPHLADVITFEVGDGDIETGAAVSVVALTGPVRVHDWRDTMPVVAGEHFPPDGLRDPHSNSPSLFHETYQKPPEAPFCPQFGHLPSHDGP